MDKSTAYSVLGLSEAAKDEQIKAAYVELANKYGSENYESGPLFEEAQKKMEDLNVAFDTVMSYRRTGAAPAQVSAAKPETAQAQPRPQPNHQNSQQNAGHSAATSSEYAQIRMLINEGRADEALARLGSVQGGASDAEWNFLMGSAYYYKGWLNEAFAYFQTACRLAPENREYEAAFRNLKSRAEGEMPGTPFNMRKNPDDIAALDCACSTCNILCCMDMCLRGCRGC